LWGRLGYGRTLIYDFEKSDCSENWGMGGAAPITYPILILSTNASAKSSKKSIKNPFKNYYIIKSLKRDEISERSQNKKTSNNYKWLFHFMRLCLPKD
jgi:hypothetical protein